MDLFHYLFSFCMVSFDLMYMLYTPDFYTMTGLVFMSFWFRASFDHSNI